MKELVCQKNFTYKWWREDGKEIKDTHVDALKETAETEIHFGLAHGSKCGELLDNIYMDETDGENGIDYRGCWMCENNQG